MSTVSEFQTLDLKERSKQVIDDILNGSNLDMMPELLSDDLVVHGLGAESDTASLPEFEEKLQGWRTAVPTSKDRIDDLLIDGATVVLFCTRTGSLEEEYPGIPPAAIGNSFDIDVIHKLRFEDGKVVEWWRLANSLGMAKQLGVLPDSPMTLVRFLLGNLKHRLIR